MKNVWDLNLDIKFRYSGEIPLFRRKDSAVLNMHLYDAKVKKDISNFEKATLNIKYPSGVIKDFQCVLKGSGIDTYVEYQFEPMAMLEEGAYQLLLSVEKDRGIISTQKFLVTFFDAVGKPEYAFVEMMQDLQNQINYMYSIIDNLILREQVGMANGLIPLNAEGKIDLKYMPAFLEEHIKTNIYLNMVHGFSVDKDFKLVYETKSGSKEYVGHKESSGGGQLNLVTTISSGVVKLQYSGRGSAIEQRWLEGNKTVDDMKSSGTLFTGLEFKVTNTGIYTIYYKDNYNNEYLYKFTVTQDQLPALDFNPTVKEGEIIYNSNSTIALRKIYKGTQTLDWMRRDGNGMVITNDYRITEVGTYTIYIKDSLNREKIKVIIVTQDMLKPIVDDRPLEIRIYTNGWSTIDDPDKKIPVGAVSTSFIVFDADGKRAGDKVDYVIRPDGVTISSDSDKSSFMILKNGTYTWKCYNKAGVESKASITVTNIGIEKNLKDMPIGSKFYLFQTECTLLKNENGKYLVHVPYSFNAVFTSPYSDIKENTNLWSNSTIKDTIFNRNYDDNEGQMVNNIEGQFNYQYATLASSYPNTPTYVGSPVYYTSKRGVLDIKSIIEYIDKGYILSGYDLMSCTPLQETQDQIVIYSNDFSRGELVTKATYPVQCMWFNDKTKVWVRGW